MCNKTANSKTVNVSTLKEWRGITYAIDGSCYGDIKDWLRERGTTTVNQELDAGVGSKPQSLPVLTTSNCSSAPNIYVGWMIVTQGYHMSLIVASPANLVPWAYSQPAKNKKTQKTQVQRRLKNSHIVTGSSGLEMASTTGRSSTSFIHAAEGRRKKRTLHTYWFGSIVLYLSMRVQK